MTTRLRLHVDETESLALEVAGPATIPFPLQSSSTQARSKRERLVAGRVHKAAIPEEGPAKAWTWPVKPPPSEPIGLPSPFVPPAMECIDEADETSGVLARPFAGAKHRPDVVTSDRLIAEIEATLERMQGRLETLREDVDQVFKFPASGSDDDGPRPRAA